MNTATQVTENFDTDEWKGDARLYRLDPPALYIDGFTEYVVVSALDVAARRAEEPMLAMLDAMTGVSRQVETMVFPTDASGNTLDWGELALVEALDHDAALAELGYTVGE